MKPIAIASLIALGSLAVAAQQADTALSPDERRMTQYIDGINAEGLALLERVELLLEHLAHLAHAFEVLRAAVDVHDAFEQRQPLGVDAVDVLGHAPFVWRQAALLRGDCCHGGQDEENRDGALHALNSVSVLP